MTDWHRSMESKRGRSEGPNRSRASRRIAGSYFWNNSLRRLGIAPANATDQLGKIVVIGHGRRLVLGGGR